MTTDHIDNSAAGRINGWVLMRSLLRMLALALGLMSFIAPQVLGALQPPADCAEEEASCTDCSTCTVPCGCCTVRVAALAGLPQDPARSVPEQNVVARLDEPVLVTVNPDIFHPPRA